MVLMNKQRLIKLISHYRDDNVVLGLIESALKGCWRYVVAVNDLELFMMMKDGAAEGEEYRFAVSGLDKTRTLAHNSLISDVTAMNRLCVKAAMEPVFSGNINNRVEVGNFAKEIVTEFFEKRRI